MIERPYLMNDRARMEIDGETDERSCKNGDGWKNRRFLGKVRCKVSVVARAEMATRKPKGPGPMTFILHDKNRRRQKKSKNISSKDQGQGPVKRQNY